MSMLDIRQAKSSPSTAERKSLQLAPGAPSTRLGVLAEPANRVLLLTLPFGEHRHRYRRQPPIASGSTPWSQRGNGGGFKVLTCQEVYLHGDPMAAAPAYMYMMHRRLARSAVGGGQIRARGRVTAVTKDLSEVRHVRSCEPPTHSGLLGLHRLLADVHFSLLPPRAIPPREAGLGQRNIIGPNGADRVGGMVARAVGRTWPRPRVPMLACQFSRYYLLCLSN
ncbi:hypothetical protein GGS23DRAFT_147685 [Durotheca rogersii]|uniref:uncharacterized protein n=1 Tax=Durotheca rogersii TaxID=419775 RepID=UPI0022206F13|nr:uncharacterized protein GGS23DRAFT_147685 [Durotheca rogersii]KAI5861351.1 hypothetical protein GGS23DRAFT_147685 [Durotheca rogersii]